MRSQHSQIKSKILQLQKIPRHTHRWLNNVEGRADQGRQEQAPRHPPHGRQQTNKKEDSMMSINLWKIGYCIYCGTRERPLSKEHIIPYGLGGVWILGEASCDKCATITSEFEMDVLRNTFGPFRISSILPTRQKKERPDSFTLSLIRHDGRK